MEVFQSFVVDPVHVSEHELVMETVTLLEVVEHVFPAITETAPEETEAPVYETRIETVPAPEVITAPAGTDHVYVTAFATLEIL